MQEVTSNDADSPNQSLEPTLNALLRAERNRWFLLALALAIGIAIAVSFAWSYANLANNNKDIVYVKLYPNGTWETVDYQAQDAQLYFKTTVDSLLANYVRHRYGLNPSTVTRDYGEASLLMDSELQREFLSEDGFYAAQKAADAVANPSQQTDIEWQFNDHYDQIEGMANGLSTDIIRTNIYFTRSVKTSQDRGKAESLMLRIQWRLLPKSELEKQSKEFLKVNPIGLQILTQHLTQAGQP